MKLAQDNFFGPQAVHVQHVVNGKITKWIRYGYETGKKLYDIHIGPTGEKEYALNCQESQRYKIHEAIEKHFNI